MHLFAVLYLIFAVASFFGWLAIQRRINKETTILDILMAAIIAIVPFMNVVVAILSFATIMNASFDKVVGNKSAWYQKRVF